MSISDNIKRLREKYNLTQIELGKIAGVSDKAVSSWENGTAEPRIGAVQKIADHFGIKKSEVIDDDPDETYHFDPETAEIVNAAKERPEMKALFSSSRKLSPQDAKTVLDIIEAFKKNNRG